MNCPAVDRGPTGWCASGNHGRCPYRQGGALAGGIRIAECYVTMPARGGAYVPTSSPQVVEPSHVYRCDCDCHAGALVGQLDLFGALA